MAKTMPVKKMTFLGARAEVKEIRQAGADGVREFRYRWLDRAIGQTTEWEAGTVISRTIKGNSHRGTFEVLTDWHQIDEF